MTDVIHISTQLQYDKALCEEKSRSRVNNPMRFIYAEDVAKAGPLTLKKLCELCLERYHDKTLLDLGAEGPIIHVTHHVTNSDTLCGVTLADSEHTDHGFTTCVWHRNIPYLSDSQRDRLCKTCIDNMQLQTVQDAVPSFTVTLPLPIDAAATLTKAFTNYLTAQGFHIVDANLSQPDLEELTTAFIDFMKKPT